MFTPFRSKRWVLAMANNSHFDRAVRRAFFFFFLLAVCGKNAPAQEPAKTAENNPGRAQIAPELVGEGVVSTVDDEFGGGPSPDGTAFYFNKTVSPHYLYVLCEAKLIDGKWGHAEILRFSGQYRDTDAVLSPDGKTIYFASDRPVQGVDRHRFLIWQSHQTEKGWSDATLLPGAINSEGNQVFASVAKNGTMYFTSSRKTGQYDIFRSKLVQGKYEEAEDLGPVLNGPGIWTFESWVAPDESYLLLGSFGRAGGLGSADIYVSFNQNGIWSKPANLGSIVNSNARDYSPRVSADGKWLYFASERGGPYENHDKPYTYGQFTEEMHSVRNGLGNIYRVPLQPILHSVQAQTIIFK
jgi:hypothetical protein